jgi:hypothetical protein
MQFALEVTILECFSIKNSQEVLGDNLCVIPTPKREVEVFKSQECFVRNL